MRKGARHTTRRKDPRVGEPPLCLSGVLRPYCPPRPYGRLTPASPRTRGTQRPQSSQPNYPKQIRPRHTRTHKAPWKLCQTQTMQWGRACRRIKATQLICRLKFRRYPMQSITSPHRVILTTVDLKNGTGTWAAHGGATTTGLDATHPATIFQNLGGGGPSRGSGGSGRGSGGGLAGGQGGVWPGVIGASSQG